MEMCMGEREEGWSARETNGGDMIWSLYTSRQKKKKFPPADLLWKKLITIEHPIGLSGSSVSLKASTYCTSMRADSLDQWSIALVPCICDQMSNLVSKFACIFELSKYLRLHLNNWLVAYIPTLNCSYIEAAPPMLVWLRGLYFMCFPPMPGVHLWHLRFVKHLSLGLKK